MSTTWRDINGLEIEPWHVENEQSWVALNKDDILDISVLSTVGAGSNGSFGLDRIDFYPADRGPVVFAPSDLEIVETSGGVEAIIILSNSAYRLNWTLTPWTRRKTH